MRDDIKLTITCAWCAAPGVDFGRPPALIEITVGQVAMQRFHEVDRICEPCFVALRGLMLERRPADERNGCARD